jgi:hypothetical protein
MPSFQIPPPHIHQLTDEYRWAVPVSPAPHIFIGCHVTDEYMWSVEVKTDNPYIHWGRAQTEEYNFIFVSSKTDEYNLNMFVGANEYEKKPTNECCFLVV